MPLITCENASFAYEGVTVVSGLSFTVESGAVLCIVGENGSGKSTLAKGILGLKQPQSGSIRYGEGLTPSDIGYLPQHTAVRRDFPAGVYEVVLSGRLGTRGLKPFYSREDKSVADYSMKRLYIEDLRHSSFSELSGGQRQRVLIARALCAARKLLLLDEPAAGLDPLVSRELYALIEELRREAGLTVVMVSHDIHSAVKCASHILHVKNEQAFFGKVKDYANSEAGRAFLGGERVD